MPSKSFLVTVKSHIRIALAILSAFSAPSHYLNQYRVIVSWSLSNELQWNFIQNTKPLTNENASENILCEMAAIFFSGDELKGAKRIQFQVARPATGFSEMLLTHDFIAVIVFKVYFDALARRE